MIVEAAAILAPLVGGTSLLRTVGIRGWPLPALGFVAGLCVQVVIGTIQAVTGLPTTPVLTLTVTAVAPASWWLVSRLRGRQVGVKVWASTITLAGTLGGVVALRAANLVSYHLDTYLYLSIGGLIANGRLETVRALQLERRVLAVPVLHAPANLADELYLRSLTPLLAVATLGVLAWLCHEALRATMPRAQVVGFTAAGVLLLLSGNRFVFHGFYVNGHMLVAVLLLLLAGTGWLSTRSSGIPAVGLLTLQVLAIPALVVTRPEAALVAGLAVLPFVTSHRTDPRARTAITVTLGLSIAVWHGFLALQYLRTGATMPSWILLMVALGLGTAVITRVPGAWRLWRHDSVVLRTVEIGLWVGVAYAALRAPTITTQSATAALHNLVLVAPSWGLSLVLLTALVIVVLRWFPLRAAAHLRFPLTTFVPLAMLLPYLRDEAYRIAEADSLNRMMIHVVPLAVLFVVAGAGSGSERETRST